MLREKSMESDDDATTGSYMVAVMNVHLQAIAFRGNIGYYDQNQTNAE